jgi:kynurenine formamidase
MKIELNYHNHRYEVDLSNPIDISIPLKFNDLRTVNAWYCPLPEAFPQQFSDINFSVEQGASVNSFGVKFFPHGNGTHTEGVGHIDKKQTAINAVLNEFHFIARLITLCPTRLNNGDCVILKEQLINFLSNIKTEALIIRTLPNDILKRERDYSGINPPYMEDAAMAFIVEHGIKHLLIDTPSVDKEDDGGKVTAHHIFWKDSRALMCTITELIYVPDTAIDGLYLLNMQVPAFELDAAPSRPVLFELKGVF